MQGSAWCIKQHKVFRFFSYTGSPNRIPLELWKRSRFSEGKRKEKVTPEFWRVKKRKKIQLQNSGRYTAVARARAVRGTEHGRTVFTPWERVLSLSQEGT
jgi:hypothetical protein